MEEDVIIKVSPDKEKAKNLFKMIQSILERIENSNKKKFTSLIVSDYYEIIKELITAILISTGIKTLSHKKLIEQTKEFKEINEKEYYLMDELRIIRNKINYDGFFVEYDYLERKERDIKTVIKKLSKILQDNI
ncbi:hypothetical protein COS64_03250 [archaeon CG06_land_8_20_14_3_00_37_11]|nr:MAG: hypothetical protein COS64_03250 [archaeon CG06_land_8_20_14_3_00_37_11]